MVATLSSFFYVVVAYLIGSICSAVIVCYIFDLPDPRLEGSKNPGATNVLRIAGKQYAIIVLIVDMLKGLLPVLLAKVMGAGAIAISFTCLAAVLGHMYPFFFGFKGGKGVATAIGALLGFHFILGVMAIVTWLLVANIWRYSSLASIFTMTLTPLYSLFAVGSAKAFLPLSIITILIIYQHRENIARLIDGTESRITFHRTYDLPDAIKSTSSQKKKAKSTKKVKKPTPDKKTSVVKKVLTNKTPTTKKTRTTKKTVKKIVKKRS